MRSPRKFRAPDGKLVANPNKNWSDIDKSLPNIKIEVLGPPPTSGTRDSLHELFMEKGAEQIPALVALKKSDAKAFEKAWKSMREDGAYVEAGENDNVIVQKLEANKNAFGIFGYSFLEENSGQAARRRARRRRARPTTTSPAASTRARVRCSSTSRSSTSASSRASTSSRPSTCRTKAIGEDGYLAKKGLVTLPKAEARGRSQGRARHGPDADRRARNELDNVEAAAPAARPPSC